MKPFVPPPYPYERLTELQSVAEAWQGGCVDLSVGTPRDDPPRAVVKALGKSGTERGYPPSVGIPALREAASRWMERRLGATVEPDAIAASVGSKEFVAGLPHWLRLRRPDLDTVLYPAVSYPSYAMGATLAGCRAVPVETLDGVGEEDAARALCLWVNSPSNPTGQNQDLGAAAAWGRARGIPVFSDECYVEFTWSGEPHTILEHGAEGVVAVHSLSKRSNLAGARVGFYAGDADLVEYLREVRKHAGFMVPGPVQAAAVVALDDDDHVEQQRQRYRERLELGTTIFGGAMPEGAFYLWVQAEDGDGWRLATRLAKQGGALVSPGEFYGPEGAGHVRIALVEPLERLELVAERLTLSRHG